MDAASSSSSSSSYLPTDVFLSFRGQDTRESFVCHLYKALERKTLKVYLDNEELKTGDDLSDLQKAIAESKISIVVFSENYATSTWCLKELVKILKCKKGEQKQIVMPIFYRVDPSDIRKQRGSFGEAFAEHERDPEKDKEEVQGWRSALKEVASMVGCHSKNFGDDAELIDDIVKKVFDKVNRISPHSHTEDGLVAMDSHLHQVRRLLNDAPDDVCYVGIWGMGGLGKTTIAWAVYHRISHEFDHCCFLENVREGFAGNGQVEMQRRFLSGILNEKDSNLDADYMMMLKRLGNKKILVVLDDVLDSTQINTLLGRKPSFGAGSIIIVTTRDKHAVSDDHFKRYMPKPLSDQDALKLFSQNAFEDTYKPSGEYERLSRCIVKYAHGLPLALEVLGRLLRKRRVSHWKDQLKKLKECPRTDLEGVLENVLKISYDGLKPSQQVIFLDIACFFKGMEKDCVTKVLDNCDCIKSRLDLDVLVERALVTISYSKTLEMHDLLQEMGRKIEEGGKRSRFWGEEAEHVLTGNTATENAGRLMIDLPKKKGGSFNTSMRIFTYRQSYAGDDGENHLTGDFKFLSRGLKVLVWHGYPQKCLPSNFDPKNLVLLDVRYSNFEQLWEGTKPAENLRSINLSSSRYLKRIPDLTLATNLTELNFQGCSSLTEVHPSISALKNLVFLNFLHCNELRSLPSIGHMKSLKTLVLSYCLKFEMFPEISEVMEALSKLDLLQTAIKELPSSIERLRGLKSLDMTFCGSLIRLPDSICNLAELRDLSLRDCSKLCKLPGNIGNLESLLELRVYGTGLKQLPVSILRLKLARLSFSYCQKMAAPLSSWPSSIEDCCTAVVHLDFSGCNLKELSDAIAYFRSLKVLNLSRNRNLRSLPAAMNQLRCLEQLKLEDCKRLRSIPDLSSRISYINAHNCTALEAVSIPQCPYDIGRCFIFSNCHLLVQKDLFRDIVKTHSPTQRNCSRPFYVSLPGSEIPEWFTHRCRGSSVTAKLPPNWFDNKFLGFSICAVTNKPEEMIASNVSDPHRYFKLTARCFCTFKGDLCEYRFSFYLFDVRSAGSEWFESNHMLVGYVPWSESGMIKTEEVNERRYTEAKFEIQLDYRSGNTNRSFGLGNGFDPRIESCGVRFVFANSEEDFGEPMAEVDNSERSSEGCAAEPSGTDITNEDEQYLKLSQVFKGANRPPSYIEIEDNDLSGKRKALERWTQKVRVASGLMQGCVDDGFKWSWNGSGIHGSAYYCGERVQRRCWAQAIKPTHDDPTIFQITYVGRHTCWKFQPMLTHQVGVTPDMRIEGPFDGFTWGKYDQMDIPGAEYPRVYYYVCTPQNVKGCMAIKEVQHSSDKKILRITYRGRHTCIEASDSIAGWFERFESKGSVESSFHEQVVLSPSSPGANSQDMSNRKEVTAKKSKGEEVAELEVEKTEKKKKKKDKDNGVLDSSDGEKSVKVKRHKGKEEAGSPQTEKSEKKKKKKNKEAQDHGADAATDNGKGDGEADKSGKKKEKKKRKQEEIIDSPVSVPAKKSKGEEAAELKVEKSEKKKKKKKKDKDNGVLDSSDGEKSVNVEKHKDKEEAGSPQTEKSEKKKNKEAENHGADAATDNGKGDGEADKSEKKEEKKKRKQEEITNSPVTVPAKKGKGEEVAGLEVEKTEKKKKKKKDKDNGVLDSSDGEKSVKVKKHKDKEEAGSPQTEKPEKKKKKKNKEAEDHSVDAATDNSKGDGEADKSEKKKKKKKKKDKSDADEE